MRQIGNLILGIFVIAALMGCNMGNCKKSNQGRSMEVNYKTTSNYFIKNGVGEFESSVITTKNDFDTLFGMAAVMGPNGKPTAIDFDNEYVIVVDGGVTDRNIEMRPGKMVAEGDSLYFNYDIVMGAKQSYASRPFLMVVVPDSIDGEVVLMPKTSYSEDFEQ